MKKRRKIACLLSMLLICVMVITSISSVYAKDKEDTKAVYPLTIAECEGGKIQVKGQKEQTEYYFSAGDQIELEIQAENGYVIKEIQTDDIKEKIDVSNASEIKIFMASHSVHLIPIFEKISNEESKENSQETGDMDQEPPKDLEADEKREQQMKQILKEIGVGFAEQSDTATFQLSRVAGERINTGAIKTNIGKIDVVDYNGSQWKFLLTWQEGKLGNINTGEGLYCTNPTISFQPGIKTGVDASTIYNKATIQAIVGMMYYYDHFMCKSISDDYAYLFKQCAVEATIPKFKISTVFDIEQTEGEPIPKIEVFDLTGHVKEFFTFMDAVMKISPVSIRYDEIESGAKGYYHLEQNEIVIRRGMSESQTMKTAIHECAHAILHNRDKMQEGEKDRQTKEVEAESVAYIVCNYFGLDTSDYSFPYIATWGSGREMKELKDSLNLIKQTAGTFIEQLSEKIEEIKKDQYYYIADDTRGGHLALSTYDDLQKGLDAYFAMQSTTKTFEMVIDGMSGDHVTLLSNINGEDRVNSELIEMDSLGRKLESTLEIIQKEVDRHNAIVEKDVKLSFYAAECDDFPILGEYHENIETFEEAIKIYEKLKKDRFLEDGGIGFKLTVNGKYEGRFTLIQGLNRVIGLEKEGSFMDHPMINQVVDQAKRYVKSFEKSEMIQATVKRNTTKIEL